MRVSYWVRALVLLLAAGAATRAQVIDFESNGLRYQALTRNGLTIMLAPMTQAVREYGVLQIAVSNGSDKPQALKPEDFLFLREDGGEVVASSAKSVVNSLIDHASRGDVVKLVTAYENGIYGNAQYKGTNGYEQRRQSAMTEFTSTKLRAAAAASAIAFVKTRLAPGESTDGAIFYPTDGKPLSAGTVRVRAVAGLFEFPLAP